MRDDSQGFCSGWPIKGGLQDALQWSHDKNPSRFLKANQALQKEAKSLPPVTHWISDCLIRLLASFGKDHHMQHICKLQELVFSNEPIKTTTTVRPIQLLHRLICNDATYHSIIIGSLSYMFNTHMVHDTIHYLLRQNSYHHHHFNKPVVKMLSCGHVSLLVIML